MSYRDYLYGIASGHLYGIASGPGTTASTPTLLQDNWRLMHQMQAAQATPHRQGEWKDVVTRSDMERLELQLSLIRDQLDILLGRAGGAGSML